MARISSLRVFYGIMAFVACETAGWAWERLPAEVARGSAPSGSGAFLLDIPHAWNFTFYVWLAGSILAAYRPAVRFFRALTFAGMCGVMIVKQAVYGIDYSLAALSLIALATVFPRGEDLNATTRLRLSRATAFLIASLSFVSVYGLWWLTALRALAAIGSVYLLDRQRRHEAGVVLLLAIGLVFFVHGYASPFFMVPVVAFFFGEPSETART